MKQINVAVGVVFSEVKPDKGFDSKECDSKNSSPRYFFICRRNAAQHEGNKWEFPGGKVNADESPLDALKRELKEEIDIDVRSAEPLVNISFDYPDKSVCLHVFLVSDFSGEAIGAEGQQSLWVEASTLSSYTFPDANVTIIESLVSKGLI